MTGDARTHRTACVLSVGDELVLGQGLDTNARWISERLLALGVRPIEHVTVEDDLERQRDILREMARRADVVVVTGGLGPTKDDLTRQALASAMDDELVEDEGSLEFLFDLERERGRTMTDERRAQALRPSRGRSLDNGFGTAPGRFGTVEGCDVICLPGPPREMRPRVEAHVAPALRPAAGARTMTRVLRTYGLAEADAGARLGALMERAGVDDTMVGVTASGGIVSVRMRARDGATLDRLEAEAREAMGETVFGYEDETLERLVVRLLGERGERVTVAESCTGGLLGASITSVPGSSDVYNGGVLTYADEAKTYLLGVQPDVFESHGAVSEPCARSMAEGALRAPTGVRAAHALAVTGIAGPGGGSDEKPVGTVFIGYARRGHETVVKRFLIAGDRDDVRARSVVAALGMLSYALRGAEAPGRLLWEVDL